MKKQEIRIMLQKHCEKKKLNKILSTYLKEKRNNAMNLNSYIIVAENNNIVKKYKNGKIEILKKI